MTVPQLLCELTYHMHQTWCLHTTMLDFEGYNIIWVKSNKDSYS